MVKKIEVKSFVSDEEVLHGLAGDVTCLMRWADRKSSKEHLTTGHWTSVKVKCL